MKINNGAFWRPARGDVFTVEAGQVWATREGDSTDLILNPGDSLDVAQGGWLLQAVKGHATIRAEKRG